ncbi:hypothetical protein HYPSUDRAFT_59205 [Hypholoma sublateritium FD-334 SS-4]|uniref:Uncharacterized protein n=1 Tax=Hypholoma sublateritium (strain FD-334 SS-4) TaxID=945553 RepID=A0A0D2NDQ4_HYPSF|nr:hypothetical protein HYPSUDRAFT_59205 [Hypholoma sublateritium FD-334 SS-4]
MGTVPPSSNDEHGPSFSHNGVWMRVRNHVTPSILDKNKNNGVHSECSASSNSSEHMDSSTPSETSWHGWISAGDRGALWGHTWLIGGHVDTNIEGQRLPACDWIRSRRRQRITFARTRERGIKVPHDVSLERRRRRAESPGAGGASGRAQRTAEYGVHITAWDAHLLMFSAAVHGDVAPAPIHEHESANSSRAISDDAQRAFHGSEVRSTAGGWAEVRGTLDISRDVALHAARTALEPAQGGRMS